MPDNDNGSGAAASEIAASMDLAKALTLFQIEESLVLLAESAEEEGLTPEIEQAMTVYLEGAAEKRDRVADFIHFCEGMAELAKAEGKRLQLDRSISKQQRSALAPWCSVSWTTSE
jgi:hypothetical protein